MRCKMVKIKHEDIILADDEYVITPEHHTARDYTVFYKGKEIDDAVGVIRKQIGDANVKKPKSKKNK